jgi:hypothetical protein
MEETKQEQTIVKVVEDNTPPLTPQEKEANVLEQAIDQGQLDKKYSAKEVDGVVKVDLDKIQKQKENAIQDRRAAELPVGKRTADSQKVDSEVRVEPNKEDTPVEQKIVKKEVEQPDSPLELITEEEETKNEPVKKEIVKEEVKIEKEPDILPENIDKLVKFMEDTGGTVEDYVELNKDISKYDNTSLLREYYTKTKPHLDSSDIDFLLNKNFGYDAETEDPSDVKAKQLAFKEELFNAQNHFAKSKETYYADLKLRKQNDIAPEYKEAYDYYNKQQDLIKENEILAKDFLNKTDAVFSDDFKGFDFSVGKNKYRFKVENPLKVKDFQSDIKNFANEFIGDDGTVADAKGYHKALFAGRNADKIANHFYEQGRADSIREQAKLSKNIDMSPRVDNTSIVNSNGQKIKVVSGDDSSKLRIKWNK